MMNPNKKTARLAGLFFLAMVVFGMFSEIFFRQKLFVATDAALTAGNISSNGFLYGIGILSDILMSLSYMLTGLALYRLLSSVNRSMAVLMAIFASAGSILLMFNILNEYAPFVILSGNDYLSTFSSSQLQSLALLYFKLYEHGYVIGQVFFALWVLPLGLLIYKSDFIPKVFGFLFVAQTIFGLMSGVVHFLAPNGVAETILLIPATIAELSFMLWLLIWGISRSKKGKMIA